MIQLHSSWGNEAGTAHSLCDVLRLLEAGVSDLVIGPYATQRELELADVWISDIEAQCAEHRARLWISVAAKHESEYGDIAHYAYARGLERLELDITYPYRFPEAGKKRSIWPLNFSNLNNLLSAVRRSAPHAYIAVKVPSFPEKTISEFALKMRYHGIERVVAIAPPIAGVVIPIRPDQRLRTKLHEARQEEALRMIYALRNALPVETDVVATANIETPTEAFNFLRRGANGFQIGPVIFSKERNAVLQAFSDAFKYPILKLGGG